MKFSDEELFLILDALVRISVLDPKIETSALRRRLYEEWYKPGKDVGKKS